MNTTTKSNEQKITLIQKVSKLFNDKNKVKTLSFVVCGDNIKVFYIECLIDKKLLSSSVLAPIEKLATKKEQELAQSSSKEQFLTKTNNSSKQNTNSQNETDSNVAKNKSKKSTNNKNDLALQDNNNSTSTQSTENGNNTTSSTDILLNELKTHAISLSSIEQTEKISEIEKAIFSGAAVVVTSSGAIICPLFSPEKRSIAEPPTSRVIKGPREGFVEDIFTNEGLIRKRIRSSDLEIEDIFIGRRTKTQVSLFYLKSVAKPDVIKLVKKRLSSIDIDAILDSYYIESFLEADNLKYFKRVGNTEKPDIFCAKILEGRVGILVDGSPVALTVPFMMFEDLQSAEDYYNIPAIATFARIIRIIGLIFALLIPGIYVALQSYNYRILPINFLITLLSSIEGLSIPPLVEIMIVLFLFEIITEASLRMPNSLGMALSIIGALALGNTAVDAGIISPPSIVVVAVSSVAIYIIPDQIPQTRLLRLIFTAIGGIVGLYGIVTAFLILTTYLCSIESFGVLYLTPFAPSIKADKKDGYIKKPVQDMQKRPFMIAGKNKTRQGGKDER